MKIIIDTEKRTIDVEGKTTKASYNIFGGCDIEFSRKIEAIRIDGDSTKIPIPVGRVALSINNLRAIEKEFGLAGEIIPIPEPPEDRDVRTPGFRDFFKG